MRGISLNLRPESHLGVIYWTAEGFVRIYCSESLLVCVILCLRHVVEVPTLPPSQAPPYQTISQGSVHNSALCKDYLATSSHHLEGLFVRPAF